MSILEVKNLKKNFGSLEVLKGIDFSLEKGEALAMIGASGSGKTTLLRCLNFLERPTHGQIIVNDKVIFDADDNKSLGDAQIRKNRLHFGMVFQSFALWPNMTVRQHVEFPMKSPKQKHLTEAQKKEAVDAAIENMGLKPYEDRYPGELSGGQRQRVSLARAIVGKPSILLMDEPLSALDAELKISMRRVIQDVHRMTGATIIYVTHDQSEALAMADRILIMKNGKIEQVGTPEEIYLHPQTEFAASFVSKCNFVRGQWNDSYFKVMDQSLIYDGPEVAQAFKNHGLFPVRPEQFHIVKEGKGIPATVTNRQYSGREIHYSLKCGEDTFTVYAGSREQYEPGEQVKLVYQAS